MCPAPARFSSRLAASALLACGTSNASAAALPPIDAGTSLLVVSPHPDDESLCCAGVIQRVVRAGGQVAVVWITSGDAAWIDLLLMSRSLFPTPARARELGERRMAEARDATARLGVPPTGQLFLGYPDGGIEQLLGAHRATPYTSRTTAIASVPYADALYPGHPYTGAALERDFLAVLERVKPTLILAPSELDSHPDHRSAGRLTHDALARLPGSIAVRYWIVHGGEGWPSPRALLPGIPLTPPPSTRPPAPVAFDLTVAEEDRKLGALEAYATQLRVMAPFLLAFVRTNELFSLPAELAAPPARARVERIAACMATPLTRDAVAGASDRSDGRGPRRCSRAADRARHAHASGGG
jgi:LmbE family N-acetylglucosaminyl deacetylase